MKGRRWRFTSPTMDSTYSPHFHLDELARAVGAPRGTDIVRHDGDSYGVYEIGGRYVYGRDALDLWWYLASDAARGSK